MADKVPYSEIMTRMHGDINYIAEEAYRDGYDHCEKEMREKIEEAYKRGINDGSLDVKQRAEGAYQRGLEDGKAVNDKGCEGCKLQGTDSNICDQCCNSYANQWKSKDDKIEVGDTVNIKDTSSNDGDGIVTKVWNNLFYIMWNDGSGGMWDKENVVKTGRHFDIASILEDMRND